MTDDAFHLTSHDVRAQEFQKVMRGYDPAQVEEFKQRMAEEIDRLIRDRVQLDERIKGMSEQLRSYRDRERAMNEALVGAQQLRTEIQVQVERERDVALREAGVEAERILQQARMDEQRITQSNDQARRQFQAYVTAYRQLLEQKLGELDALGGEG